VRRSRQAIGFWCPETGCPPWLACARRPPPPTPAASSWNPPTRATSRRTSATPGRGEAPIASHLLYTQPGVLDDTDSAQRAQGIAAGLAWRDVADASVFYVDRGMSGGMLAALEAAIKAEAKIEIRRLEGWAEKPAEPEFAIRRNGRYRLRGQDSPSVVVRGLNPRTVTCSVIFADGTIGGRPYVYTYEDFRKNFEPA
jgi:hypothetical protein